MKDWKGNSDSVRSRLGINKAHTTKGRDESDYYATDPKALQQLLDGCSEWLKSAFNIIKGEPLSNGLYRRFSSYIWECACGNGNLGRVLIENGFNVVATDIKDRGYGISRDTDFLHTNLCLGHIILTNPPYSFANEFIKHALEILPNGGLYIALMNITYLAGQKRYKEIYSQGVLREVYIFSKRIECWRNNDREQYGNKAMVDFAWYVFQKGYNGQPALYWL